MTFDNLPIDDPKAARLKMLITLQHYLGSWKQSHLDGGIDGLALDKYNESGLHFAQTTDDFLYRIEERLDDEPRRWNWVFEEEVELRRPNRSSVVVLKMPASWVDKVKKQEGK